MTAEGRADRDPAGPATDEESAARIRKEMGEELKRRRSDAGLSQEQFAAVIGGYSRETVSHAEHGRDRIGRRFWQAVDKQFGTGGFFTDLYDEIRERLEPEKRTAVRGADCVPCELAMQVAEPDRALESYQRRGWPVVVRDDALELQAGKTADVLEVALTVGAVAAGAWLETGGVQGALRGLPRLPAPDSALAVIEARERWFFLVRPGFPWQVGGVVPRSAAGAPQIFWHSAGSRVPLPPSMAGQSAARWVYLPAAVLQLPPPLAVLDLLGWAVAMTCEPGMLRLPGGAAAAPAAPRP